MADEKELSALILYKDKTFKIIDTNKLRGMNFSDPKIKIIFIPNLEAPNSYIPIKPSIYYNFSKAVVDIAYQGFVTNAYEDMGYPLEDLMEDLEVDFTIKEYHQVCLDIVEFINAIYNLWKFRGTSIFISENGNPDGVNGYESWVIYPRAYQIQFYNALGQLTSTLDSGELKSIPEKYADKRYHETPIEYCQEEYMEGLKDILYTPLCKDHIPADGGDFGILPRMICLDDDMWMDVKKPGQILSPLDYVLVKIEDYGCYYYTHYGIYQSMLKINFSLQIYAWNVIASNSNYLRSLDKLRPPTMSEKLDAIQSIEIHENEATFEILANIQSPEKVIEVILFLRHITSCLHYLLRDIFGEPTQEEIEANPNEGTRLRVLTIFNPEKQAANTPNRILSELELTDEKIQNAILSFMKED